ncbi:hypothetical protein H257_16017 [Aphanomyces astaci]|uniref:Prenyltransferase alpha-alpha toroid domain-containing protein n=1 Tax=Aphanomyces astaci TaxID=112090 RepID=W4FM42_APHAT|nr:hypothetical protein H257_16017 [Aphanomyces astaci]ETV67894.1 hypothetical protein H257_16017 [Aphanomyces astaci]|eukprot:XP_009842639.1 hypothetical protein H257_16017 [Aphanomyces astaci]
MPINVPPPLTAKSLPTDNWPTSTTRQQQETESLCTSFFVPLESLPPHELHQLQSAGFLNDRFEVRLLREKHVPYLVRGLDILDGWDAIDEAALAHYIAHRQMAVEGGYQGRTNKLVDGCYSFWQGSVPALLSFDLNFVTWSLGHYLSHTQAHQQYILLCGQQIEGGLRDKPGKSRDHYHSCYVLSGLSVAQTYGGVVVGDGANRLIPTHPAYNIGWDKVHRIHSYFHVVGKTEVDPMD